MGEGTGTAKGSNILNLNLEKGMTNAAHIFEDVSLLITHYNRSSSLERLLLAFQGLDCAFGQTVVSDDGSRPEHLEAVKQLQPIFGFKLVTSTVNKGLGHNMNKGQDAVQAPYTLYVQEDFVPKPAFPENFRKAMDMMHQEQDLDIVRFYAYFKYPYLKPYGKGFSEMVFRKQIWWADHLKFYIYSDHPHLRRSSFFTKFGRYTEGRKGDATEFRMCLSFIKNKGRGLFFEEYAAMFDQKNSSAEPSTMARSNWTQQKAVFILLLRWFYLKFRILKNTIELANSKQI
ncbi:glycosyltransferase family 2 protein [Pontibacter beigongshangensis]|uniref:glycosyltransferase family 2 protein n=1 Tax=Pontibacter beigongshangensis TaxID=2574733 RepID=UPI00293BBD47|nr:glycosyltransferase [Pontibacter beigongshangensis]